ncbi:MAG: metalloregulator ArsR/SmtB family transcription factor [Bacteroidales bacterium]|nr:metalloregulator ArsR/SmtB family transcription factor [Bacteroidales bacterium]
MAYAKTELFDPELNDTAVLFKALAHPARLAILKYLAEIKVCMTGDISDELPLSRTTINQHLKELKNAGLIQGTVDGVKVNYCLNPEKIGDVVNMVSCFFGDIMGEGEFRCEEGDRVTG